uniref:Uncharacterized protein n=2 Tax=Lepeophtheirus salmonis TaxID=72036 RepID=A0A0K2VC67_LEPSM
MLLLMLPMVMPLVFMHTLITQLLLMLMPQPFMLQHLMLMPQLLMPTPSHPPRLLLRLLSLRRLLRASKNTATKLLSKHLLFNYIKKHQDL